MPPLPSGPSWRAERLYRWAWRNVGVTFVSLLAIFKILGLPKNDILHRLKLLTEICFGLRSAFSKLHYTYTREVVFIVADFK
jgi:hypothetical protein